MDSKKDLHRRRERKGQESPGKVSLNPNRLPPQSPSTEPAPAKTGNSAVRTENKLPGKIRKQCVPYTTPAGCVIGEQLSL